MTWVRDNVTRSVVIITSSYLYADLLDPQGMVVGGGTLHASLACPAWEAVTPELGVLHMC